MEKNPGNNDGKRRRGGRRRDRRHRKNTGNKTTPTVPDGPINGVDNSNGVAGNGGGSVGADSVKANGGGSGGSNGVNLNGRELVGADVGKSNGGGRGGSNGVNLNGREPVGAEVVKSHGAQPGGSKNGKSNNGRRGEPGSVKSNRDGQGGSGGVKRNEAGPVVADCVKSNGAGNDGSNYNAKCADPLFALLGNKVTVKGGLIPMVGGSYGGHQMQNHQQKQYPYNPPQQSNDEILQSIWSKLDFPVEGSRKNSGDDNQVASSTPITSGCSGGYTTKNRQPKQDPQKRGLQASSQGSFHSKPALPERNGAEQKKKIDRGSPIQNNKQRSDYSSRGSSRRSSNVGNYAGEAPTSNRKAISNGHRPLTPRDDGVKTAYQDQLQPSRKSDSLVQKANEHSARSSQRSTYSSNSRRSSETDSVRSESRNGQSSSSTADKKAERKIELRWRKEFCDYYLGTAEVEKLVRNYKTAQMNGQKMTNLLRRYTENKSLAMRMKLVNVEVFEELEKIMKEWDEECV